MKVLFPIGSFYPAQGGGPCNTIYWMASALNTGSVKTSVVTTNKGLTPDEGISLNTWIDSSHGRVKYVKTRFHFLPIKAIHASFLEIRNSDVIHLTSIFYPLSIISFLIARFFNKQIIWSPRGELDDAALIYNRVVKKFILSGLKLFGCTKVLYHSTSKQESNYIRKNLFDSARVVELPNYMLLPEVLIEEVKPRFVYIGRIHPKKNLFELIDAFSRSTVFQNSQYELHIAGDAANSYGEELSRKVEETRMGKKIKFLGVVTGLEKQELYASSYFTLLPSLTENFGNVVVESLAQGTPVIASVGTPWRSLQEQNAGFWVETSSDNFLRVIEAAIRLAKHEYLEMRTQALRMATTQFDIYSNVHKWVEVYNNLKKTKIKK